MFNDLDFLIERKYHRKVKNVLWRLEPYFSKILLFFSIFQFFYVNFIIRIDYALLFSDIKDWMDIIIIFLLIGTILGGMVVLPIYSYIKFIHKKLGPKSTIANELYLSLFLLVINFILDNLRIVELYLYIFILGAFAISMIGMIFLYPPIERIISLITNSIDPIRAYDIYYEMISDRLKEKLGELNENERNIKYYLKDSDQNSENSTKIYEFLEEKKRLLEEYLMLSNQKSQIEKKFDEKRDNYLNEREVSITVNDCKEELKLSYSINKEIGKKNFYFFGGFLILLIGILALVYPLLNLQINLPSWMGFIFLPLTFLLWFFGYKIKKKNEKNLEKLERIYSKYKMDDTDR